MNHKYLIIADLGHETPVIFPASLPHDQICKQCMVNNEAVTIVAAGSVSIGLVIERLATPCEPHELIEGHAARIWVRCSGESETLSIESRGEEDGDIIWRFLTGEQE